MAIVTLGTWLMRYLPFVWMHRRIRRSEQAGGPGALPPWLGVLGPVMIAALLGMSLVPVEPGVTSWLATLAGGAATLLVWKRLRTLGWPVIAGVAVFGAVRLFLSL